MDPKILLIYLRTQRSYHEMDMTFWGMLATALLCSHIGGVFGALGWAFSLAVAAVCWFVQRKSEKLLKEIEADHGL